MPTFIRPSRQTLATRAAANHANQSYQDRQNAGCLDDDEPAPEYNGRDSSELPVITDRGPPTANRYADADTFWNSIMDDVDGIEKD
jgi:hypothetical protein